MHRISFNEITKNAVKDPLKQAREIDMDLVDAQQAQTYSGPNGRISDQSGACGQK